VQVALTAAALGPALPPGMAASGVGGDQTGYYTFSGNGGSFAFSFSLAVAPGSFAVSFSAAGSFGSYGGHVSALVLQPQTRLHCQCAVMEGFASPRMCAAALWP
jgi:hypothetical protein